MADEYLNKAIETGAGDVLVNYSPMSGLEVTIWPTKKRHTRVSTYSAGGDRVVTKVRFGRLPRVGDEVTQGGRSFEVTGVKELEDGSIHVRTSAGVWVRYEEERS